MIVSPLLGVALDDALRAALATDGLCDPTIAAALDAAGYDRTFAEIAPCPPRTRRPAGRWREIRLAGLLVRRPAGLRIDLTASSRDERSTTPWPCSRAKASSPPGATWRRRELVVALPAGDTVTLNSGALATSGVTTRSWACDGGNRAHHLIDPATGLPADVRWERSPSAPARASRPTSRQDGVPPRRRGPAWLDRQGLQGRFVAETEIVLAGGWPESSEPPVCTCRLSTTVWYAARAAVSSRTCSSRPACWPASCSPARRASRVSPRFAVEDVHRFLGILAGLFIAIHVGSIALDTVVPFSLALVILFTASYRPLATGLGIVALELLLAVAMTNRLRSRLSYRVWRRAHYATLGVWLLATGHGILSGTDRSQTWLLAVYATTVALVAGAAALRFGRAPHAATARRRACGRGRAVCPRARALPALPQQASMPDDLLHNRAPSRPSQTSTAPSPEPSTRVTHRASSRSAAPPRHSRPSGSTS